MRAGAAPGAITLKEAVQSGRLIRIREYGTSGPRVVVLHGGPGAPGYMAPVARGLAESFQVLEPLQRGRSGRPLTVARHVADLRELIESCGGGARPALVGHSLGRDARARLRGVTSCPSGRPGPSVPIALLRRYADVPAGEPGSHPRGSGTSDTSFSATVRRPRSGARRLRAQSASVRRGGPAPLTAARTRCG